MIYLDLEETSCKLWTHATKVFDLQLHQVFLCQLRLETVLITKLRLCIYTLGQRLRY